MRAGFYSIGSRYDESATCIPKYFRFKYPLMERYISLSAHWVVLDTYSPEPVMLEVSHEVRAFSQRIGIISGKACKE
jgi:hypothetical protein